MDFSECWTATRSPAQLTLYRCSPDPMSYGARPGEGGGNLNFEEDVNDIPSGLVFDEVSKKV